ncbi:hypothetical protein D1AOALGA4SA_6622 [Olavius algarvensis Delta 1 endosymbiont]|nr:hypothetical protein D1AOALGA4SA_6622 [Olavius algarvensis Delta 1 endosymbiont]
MFNKKVITRLYDVIEKFRSWSTGVLEYCGIKKVHHTYSQYSNTPGLQYSEI